MTEYGQRTCPSRTDYERWKAAKVAIRNWLHEYSHPELVHWDISRMATPAMRKFQQIIIIHFLLLIIAACASDPSRWVYTYPGATLPNDQVAVLKFYFWLPGQEIAIDGISYTPKHEREMVHFSLMPGMHEIYFVTHSRNVGKFDGDCNIELKAGNIYYLTGQTVIKGSFLHPEYYPSAVIYNRTTKEKTYCWDI